MDSVTHKDVKSMFISMCQMPNLDLFAALPDNDVAMIETLCFITAYLFPRYTRRLLTTFFALVKDFSAISRVP